jgi:hypothetical protein
MTDNNKTPDETLGRMIQHFEAMNNEIRAEERRERRTFYLIAGALAVGAIASLFIALSAIPAAAFVANEPEAETCPDPAPEPDPSPEPDGAADPSPAPDGKGGEVQDCGWAKGKSWCKETTK